MIAMLARFFALLIVFAFGRSVFAVDVPTPAFFESHCYECHDATAKGNLDLSKLRFDLADQEHFARWVKIFDRISSGEMPPKEKERPAPDEIAKVTGQLKESLLTADRQRLSKEGSPRTAIRRLTRAEYENTLRDLFDLPGIALQGNLPADGTAHGFDKNDDALDISHVNMTKYVEAADHVLNYAIATTPQAPTSRKQRISLANPGSGVAHVMLFGEAVMLKDKKPDPRFPPAGVTHHINQGLHQQMGMFDLDSSVGLFRHEDESFHPYFLEFATLYPGRYRIKTSLWSFHWDKGEVKPARGTEAGRLSVVSLQADGRHGGHPSAVIGYFGAPSLQEKEHEFIQWLNYKDTIGFNAASLVPGMSTRGKNFALGFSLPGIACDYLDIEGPLHDAWPPKSHRALFGELAITQFKPEENPNVKPPARKPMRQEIIHVSNRPDPVDGIWTVKSDQPVQDADRLLAEFLPKAFRRPVSEEVRHQYVAKVNERMAAGECFETALRWVYRAALCSSDFLYHVESAGKLDDYSLANRLAYFLWNSQPDEELTRLAKSGELHQPQVLRGQVERMLKDAKSQRFVEDFLGQWLKLRAIAANDPDKKLYPEFSGYLQDSMIAETHAYFRELLDKDLGAKYLVKSDFAMINEKLAKHYGIDGVSGPEIRRVQLPADCTRGGFLTHASVLKITANGTTTSPVPRGAFVMARFLGQEPEPPPPNIPAIEPDVRGAKTIREQLDKHRSDATCASCHKQIDPPGFALEEFDVIGGQRKRYRSIGEGDPGERGNIDQYIGIGFKLGPQVDSSGVLPDGRQFDGIRKYQELLVADEAVLLKNMAQQFAIYATGRDIAFSDRDQLAAIVQKTKDAKGGLRTVIHELVQSELFQTK